MLRCFQSADEVSSPLSLNNHCGLPLVVGVGIWLLAKLFPGKPNKPADLPDNQQSDVTGSALQILTKRYVRGEISKKQFAEMRRELER